MLVNSNTISMGLSASIIEPMINREASKYIVEHYDDIMKHIRKTDVKDEKAHDLLHDVYISIYEAESNGEGFDMEYGSKIDENGEYEMNIMDVAQFVHGRVKLYAKNNKYRTDVIENSNISVVQADTVYETEMDKHGNEVIGKDGKVKVVRRVVKHKKTLDISTHAASFNEGADDLLTDNDSFQRAFAMASVADSTDDVTEQLSLRDNIEFCISICDTANVKIINLFKNIDLISQMLGDISKKKKSAEGVFSRLTELAEYHDQFAEALISVLRYSSKNRSAFEAIISTY